MNNKIEKNAILNGVKTVCSILFPFVSFSYCSQVLGASGLGAYSFGQSIISYLALIAALGIQNYAVREGSVIRNDKIKLNHFVEQIFTINCIMTVVSYMLLIVLLVFWPKMVQYKWIILIQSLQIGLTTVGADWINLIFEDYAYLTVRYVVIQAISIVALVIFVKSPEDLYKYTFISMMSNSGGYILNVAYIRKKNIRLHLTKNINFKKYFFPIFVLFFNNVASIVYLNSDITMLGIFETNLEVGIYTVSSKIYSMMKSLLTSMIMVTVPQFSIYISRGNMEEYKYALKRLQEVLLIIIFPITMGLLLESRKIIKFVAGNQYASGSIVVSILAVAIPFAVEACFFTYAVLIPAKQEVYILKSTILAATINIILNIIFIPLYGIYAAAFTTLVAEIVVVSIVWYMSNKVITFQIDKSIIRQVMVGCTSIILVCLFIDQLEIGSTLQLLLDIVASGIVYFCVLLAMKCTYLAISFKRVAAAIRRIIGKERKQKD